MAEDDELSLGEDLIRVIKRAPDQPTDKLLFDDFQRRIQPRENGVSVFRLSKISLDEIYKRVKSKKAKGAAVTTPGNLSSSDLTYRISGTNAEHLSLRCRDCNEAEHPDICATKSGAQCPLLNDFAYIGKLMGLFQMIDEPTPRSSAS